MGVATGSVVSPTPGTSGMGRYSNMEENGSGTDEGAVGYSSQQQLPSSSIARQANDNIYQPICVDPNVSNAEDDEENIYETIEDYRQQQHVLNHPVLAQPMEEPIYFDQVSCSSTYGRIGNAYGRIDVIGHGIGRIERHLSSSCGSINSNHYAIENLYGTKDCTGRISKVSVQWLLANKWLPLWIANTETGKDYRIIDFLIAQGLDGDDDGDEDGRASYSGYGDGGGDTDSGQQPPPQQG